MAYPHLFGYDPFYKPDPPFHSPTSLPSFHDYTSNPLSHLLRFTLPFGAITVITYLILRNSVLQQSIRQDYVQINSTHFKDLRANPIFQNLNWNDGIILILRRTNHILIFNSIGLSWIHHPKNLNSIATMRTHSQHQRNF